MTPPTSTSSRSESAAAAARATLDRLVDTWGRPELGALGPEDDLFDKIDSFAVVELLLETESEVEKAVGRYVPLADESILDSTRSPLRRIQSWFDYVAEAVNRG
ncbi:hypothetical protein GOFOIKOB_6445 [Methylobacterium tardum]|jgi:hypothetical protein|uniref:Uncharacterized protein n=1 Tax=Methylobacterium tardum TaxID=374432 RepID=A0AA37WWY6_9HYPH|nr:hypothetical protein [Methylobacterium tardum]GJE53366.1 hypothetical protein GOFOIKOB_6445 [Methylobacterium tardum]GLS73903.1 hypothetical protein GCM10007890_59180 [Methylobacterium tardum]